MEFKPASEKRFALLIDADNVSSKYIGAILDELSKYGTVTYKRIYGDWTSTLHAKWKDTLLENSIAPIQQFSYTSGKNATDSALIIDAMDILYTKSVEGFCLVSSDSDFTRLAARLRESGITVIGMGEKKTPKPFRTACDVFTTLELLLGDKGRNGRDRSKNGESGSNGNGGSLSRAKIERAVVTIVTDNLNNDKATGLGEVGSRLQKRWPDFDVRNYGTNQLKKLLAEFESIVITTDGNAVRVELSDGPSSTGDAERGEGGTTATSDTEANAPEAAEPIDHEADETAENATDDDPAAPSDQGETTEKPRRSRRGRRGGARAKAAREGGEAAEEADVSSTAASAPEADAAGAESAEGAQSPAAGSDGTGDESASAPARRKRTPRRRNTVAAASEAAEAAEAAADASPATNDDEAESDAASKPAGAKRGRRRRSASSTAGASAQEQTAKAAEAAGIEATRSAAPVEDAPRPGRAARAAKAATASRRRSSAKTAATPQAAAGSAAAQTAPRPAPDGKAAALRELKRIVEQSGENGIAMVTLGKRLKAAVPAFNLKDHGFTKLADFITAQAGIAVERRGRASYAMPAKRGRKS
ncbi:NYN domain-containing protein [Berryella wangjianweii]|uniref:NYN domain-containing protein n=1 Tax=Berryella wangjianweii TaxID=2734634 RepID=A0A6M8J4B8_9ACTN|nr:NYN domain-containing protein [Berryella wangjianweii]QKF06826.1 NYN domain-containing protein [Berryella wangjianweii]